MAIIPLPWREGRGEGEINRRVEIYCFLWSLRTEESSIPRFKKFFNFTLEERGIIHRFSKKFKKSDETMDIIPKRSEGRKDHFEICCIWVYRLENSPLPNPPHDWGREEDLNECEEFDMSCKMYLKNWDAPEKQLPHK